MFKCIQTNQLRKRLAQYLVAGSVFLLPVQNAFAAVNLSLSTEFSPAETGRTYMDVGGTWDGSADAAGDVFRLTVENTGSDPAFDIKDFIVDVPSGFVVGQASVLVNDSPASCSNITGVTASLTGATEVTIGISPNTDIDPGCSYEFDLVLSTSSSVVPAPNYSVTFNSSYNEASNGSGTEQSFSAATTPFAVNAGGISLSKTTTEANPPDNTTVDFNVEIQNTGTGGLFDVRLSDVLGTGLTTLNIIPPASPNGSFSGADYIFDYVPAGATVDVTVEAITDIDPGSSTCPTLTNTASVIDRNGIVVPDSSASIPFDLGALSIAHLNTSRCVLCGTGTVRLRLRNNSAVDIDTVEIRENLLASELRIVDNTSIFNGTPIANPSRSGTEYTWTTVVTVPANSSRILTFNVVYDTASFGINEDLTRNNTSISASVDYELSCGITQPTVTQNNYLLTLDEPLPQVVKLARNVDAGQTVYAPTAFGHVDDDVIWRVRVNNNGPINMQDVVLDDSITGGNFDINYICPSEATASSVAAGGSTAGCTNAGGGVVTAVNNFLMNDPFGLAGSDDVNTSFADIFYVGKITSSCGVATNTNSIEWGCDADGPAAGGISSIDVAGSVDTGTATLSTQGNGAISDTSITHTVRGVDGGTEIGSRGVVSIAVVNNTGGTIRDVIIDDLLPTSYVVDNTFTPTFDFNSAYGNDYGGQSDQIANNIDTTPANLLNNTAPQFILTSDDTGDNPAVDVNLFRHGDSFTITFQIVLIDPARYDLVADLDLPEEVSPGTDPVSVFNINNRLTITYDDTCTFSPNESHTQNPQFPVDVEDLDVSISDALFILTNDPGTTLNLNVDVTNNGGHVADDFIVYVTLGEAMTLQNLPVTGNCSATTNLPPHPTWNDPAQIPAGAAVYACTPGTIAPNNTVRITFPVQKTNSPANDDLTFRAEVVGEIHLFGSTPATPMPLIYPAPATIAKTSPNVQQPANNYSFDAIRSRVLGFNLVKSAWYCAEDNLPQPAVPADILSPAAAPPNTPALTGNLNSQIGEDCNYRIESGGWFGFVTPGYSLIEVKNITVTDDLPDGQGFIPYGGGNFNYTSTAGIMLNGADGGAGSTPLSETDVAWNFNATVGSGISVADEFFRVDFKTRLLNDPVDLAYPVAGPNLPNLHGYTSTNIAKASFTAVFQSDPVDGVAQAEINIDVSDFANSPPGYIVPPGYPAETVRRVDLTEVEPNLIVTKQVCNETLSTLAGNGTGPACLPFADSINNGDTNDSYVYRITLENETSVPVRSPAFNVIATDTLDSSDLMLVLDFAADGLDNNGDGSAADGDPDEAAMFAAIPNNVVNSGPPAVITLNESFGAPFAQIDPGPANAVTFYYRVDPDITISPLQTLTNTVSMSFDSLDGAFGNQNPPQVANIVSTDPADNVGTVGSARVYTSIAQTADVIMIPLVAQPIIVTALSNTALGGAPHDVSVGEEVRYQLTAELPVANLRKFRIRNELPAGLSCSQIADVNLSTDARYVDAMFVPGGPPVSTQCTTTTAGNDIVEWFFDDQAITSTVLPGDRFIFVIDYIARVENIDSNREVTTLTNGGVPIDNPQFCTSAGGGGVGVCYQNDSGTYVALDFAPVDIAVREPEIVLTKTFAVANSDAGDELTVTVTAENTGNASAYNLQILDDLALSDMTYINDSMAGADVPDDDGVVADGKLPIFSWLPANPDYEILSGAANIKTFTFRVRVDTTAQPLEILDNTIQAKWDSLPGLNTALNTIPGTIGADGSNFGLRNGGLPNTIPKPPGFLNDYETTANDSTEVLPLTLNKNDLDATIIPTIGAHKNFAIVITLPEGTTNDLVVTDALNFSGLSYVLSRNATYDITYTFNDIVSINTFAPDEAVFRGATVLPSPTLPVDGDDDTITWDIGTVVTAEEIDPGAAAVNPSITINYYARVNNDLVTDDTDTLQNSATVTYDNGEDATTETLNATTAIQTVVEPLLEFALPAGAGVSVSNLTNPGLDPDGGDILEYQITLTNNGTSEAFDTNIVVTLPTQLEFDTALPVPTAFINGSAVLGFEPTPAGGTTGPLIWGKGNADNTLDVPDGETLVLTYRTVVQTITEPNTALATTVTADWTSLEDNDPSLLFERTGNGCPTITAPDDYCTTESDTINTIDDNSIVKSIISDTYNVAPLSTALDSTVRIGDTVTYRLELNIQEGTTESVAIADALPAGMAFVEVVSINGVTDGVYASPGAGPGSNFSYAAPTVPSPGDTLALNWSFGTISNDAAGDATTDTIVIEYRAQVVDNDASTIAQNPTTTLTNTADLSYIDGNNASSPSPVATPRLRSTAALTVLQPEMDDLTKLDSDGSPTSGGPVNVATDTMNFRLHSCNTTGLAPAYGLMITDNLPTELNHTTIVGPVNGALTPDVSINGAPATEGAANDYVYTPPAVRGGDMLFVFNTPIDPGECVDIDFDIGFYNNVGFGTWSNIVTVDEYYSLPSADVLLDAHLYDPLAPVQFDMSNPATASVPPEKIMTQPAITLPEATIGDEVIYEIRVPETPFGAIMYDVNITDTLDNSLIYLSASDISTNAYTITDNTVLPITAGTAIDLMIDQIPAGQQAIIKVRARVDNNADANAGVNFQNVTNYRYAMTDGATPLVNGGSDNTASTLTIIEPTVTVAKTVENITSPTLAPDAGDILRYTITMDASGGAAPGDLFSDAFDISIAETLSLGQTYSGNLTVDGLGNTIDPPIPVGDGIATAQTWNWSLADANADIDIVEGATVTVTYEVLVLDMVQANQELTNTVNVQWHSRDGPDVNQRDGSGAPALNDYFANPPAATITVADNNTVTKTRLTDTFDNTDSDVRIGDIIEYRLLVSLQEGTHPDAQIVDSLPLGMMFEETVSINGDTTAAYETANAIPAVPYTHPDIVAPAAAAGPTNITWAIGEIINPGDNTANDDFEIIYRARVLNLALAQTPATQPLNNSVDLIYDTATIRTTKNDTETINVLQPNLSVTKTRIPATDTVLDAGEVVTYRVDINNTSGTAPAYDTVLRDIIPLGMRIAGVTTTNVQLVIGGAPQPALINVVPVFDGSTGTTTWDFDSAIADQYTIPAGETLRIEYQVQADAGIGAGLTLTNEAQVQLYYSYDNGAEPSLGVAVPVREIYGPSNIATFDLTTDVATALLKENTDPTNLDASIGESFTYTITVPETMQPTALYDVQILDNLNLSAADLLFVNVTKVSGIAPWTPANIGTVAGELIIADVTNGIDIPANDQAVIEVTVTLADTATNVEPLAFNNTATYTYNQLDNNNATQSNGMPSTTADMRVVEPDLILEKRGPGPAALVNFADAIPYELVISNAGFGPAFDTTIVDLLPDEPDAPNASSLTAGMCDLTPTDIVVRITQSTTEGVVKRALTLNTDYTVTHTASPTCELVITTLTDAARIESDEKLIISYNAHLEAGSQSGAVLTNIAGVTQWFSLDTAGAGATGEIREYLRNITDGTPATVDNQDAAEPVTVEAPDLVFQKTVALQNDVNSDGIVNPGDTLRYSILIENTGPIALPDFSLTDEVDGLAPASGFFASGTMTNIVIPATADGTNTDIAGGANGAGLLDVRNLSIDEAGGTNPTILIGFDITLLPVIDSNMEVLNQAQLDSPSTGVLLSDYPVTPAVADPTPITIISAPAFLVEKTSSDITGDPAILLPGDTLRYTLTVKNIGFENAVNTLLSDQIPANTTYTVNSTTLNGVVVADPAAGISALASGMPINAPENTAAGFLRADTGVADNVATITFDVVINTSTVIGTVISNQGFVNSEGAGSGTFPQQPSDDPGTAAVDDPTLDVVGNVPLFDVQKTVALVNDLNTNGIVDPGDELRYTITATNMGGIPITNAVLTDMVPVDTTFVPNSVFLNGSLVADTGVSPLIAGIAISSSDLTPPLPLAGAGTLSPGQSAVVTFDVQVDLTAVPGVTVISNQGFVSNNELPTEPTDFDGVDANGDQPTVVTVGSAPLISIIKEVSVVGGGAALPGSQLEYIVRVTNTGIVPVTNVVITDDLLPAAAQMTHVSGSNLLDGLPIGDNLVGSTITVNFGTLPAAAITELRFRVLLASTLSIGEIVSNTGVVDWNVPTATASATVDISIGGTPGAAGLNGLVWHDTDFSNDLGAGEVALQDWQVEVYRNNILLGSVLTDANGAFGFSGLPPNLPAGDPYEIRYSAPDATATSATLGRANSVFTDGPQRITNIFAGSGSSILNLNMPRQPNGIVYDSVLRVPVAGVRLTMINQTRSNQQLSDNCFEDPKQQNQVTLADGYYKFDLDFSEATCSENDEYVIQVQPPANGYVGTTSVIIPPVEPITGTALNVPNCPNNSALDKILATEEHCETSISSVQPPGSVEPRTPSTQTVPGTDYSLKFVFNEAPLPIPPARQRVTNQIFNNHIAVDPKLEEAVSISKVAGLQNVTRSQLVPYTITISNTLSVNLRDLDVIDNFPAGFKYVAGSSRINGEEKINDVTVEPMVDGRQLTWSNLSLDVNESHVIKLLLVVGSGVSEGEYINTARILNALTGEPFSGVASATVQVIPDPTFDCSDIIGKVYDDANMNMYQDDGENGIAGAQVATARGLRVTTDEHGRFHITCAVVPDEVRGSNFIIKLDERTLPSGYRITTENPRVQRATRGKMLKFNFGAAIHRVVRLDLADGVFEKDSTELRPQWRSRIDMLIIELQKDPSILRLSYLGENETESEADDRLDAIEDLISERWEQLNCCYKLTIEKEMFWRKGNPADRKTFD